MISLWPKHSQLLTYHPPPPAHRAQNICHLGPDTLSMPSLSLPADSPRASPSALARPPSPPPGAALCLAAARPSRPQRLAPGHPALVAPGRTRTDHAALVARVGRQGPGSGGLPRTVRPRSAAYGRPGAHEHLRRATEQEGKKPAGEPRCSAFPRWPAAAAGARQGHQLVICSSSYLSSLSSFQNLIILLRLTVYRSTNVRKNWLYCYILYS